MMSVLTPRFTPHHVLRLMLVALLLGVFLAIAAPTQPASASCGGTTNIGNETELNNAIVAFNSVTTSPCVFTIELSGNIDLTASTTTIDNATAGVELVVEGSDFTVDGQGLDNVRAFQIAQDTTVSIQNITITGSNNPGGGGSDTGGAIAVTSGTLTLRSSTLRGNLGALGGAISNASGTVTVIDSTLNDNQAVGVFGLGGAIFNIGSASAAGTVTLIDSTVSGNQAPGTLGRGGGIYNSSDSVLDVINSTISGNQATNGGGGIVNTTDSTLTLNNTIVANNVGGDCLLADGTINAEYSLIEDGLACVNGTNSNNLTGDPNLGPLQDNGGPTQTHFPQKSSPVLDTGSCSADFDQRGETRPVDLNTSGMYPNVDNGCDIGAVEAQGETPTSITLQSINASATAPANWLVAALLAGFVTLVGVYVLRKRSL